jgi:hypothetical protein
MSSLALLPLFAALQFVPSAPQAVFAGDTRQLQVKWRNPDDEPVRLEIRARLLQAASTTAAPAGELASRELHVLPHQTIVETAAISFPAVTSPTRFLVQWFTGASEVFGVTEVVAYPANLLQELPSLAAGASGSDSALALIDPDDRLKPALRAAGIEFSDLSDNPADANAARLVLVASDSMPGEQVRSLAAGGRAAVWFQTQSPAPVVSLESIRPSFFLVREKKGAVVVADRSLIADLAENPVAQLHLLALVRLALQPAPFALTPAASDPR